MTQEKSADAAVHSVTPGQSRILRYREGFVWQDAIRKIYKDEPQSWRGVTRTSLVGGADGLTVPFHVRYFEVEVGGFSSREKHEHEHVVIVIRGSGEVSLGEQQTALSFGDVVYIAPWEVHQFANPEGPEPFGFLCTVPADRDRPVLVSPKTIG